MCSDCAFEPYCGAEPVYHHAIHKDVVARKPESSFCKRNMSIFKHLIELMGNDEANETDFYGVGQPMLKLSGKIIRIHAVDVLRTSP